MGQDGIRSSNTSSGTRPFPGPLGPAHADEVPQAGVDVGNDLRVKPSADLARYLGGPEGARIAAGQPLVVRPEPRRSQEFRLADDTEDPRPSRHQVETGTERRPLVGALAVGGATQRRGPLGAQIGVDCRRTAVKMPDLESLMLIAGFDRSRLGHASGTTTGVAGRRTARPGREQITPARLSSMIRRWCWARRSRAGGELVQDDTDALGELRNVRQSALAQAGSRSPFRHPPLPVPRGRPGA